MLLLQSFGREKYIPLNRQRFWLVFLYLHKIWLVHWLPPASSFSGRWCKRHWPFTLEFNFTAQNTECQVSEWKPQKEFLNFLKLFLVCRFCGEKFFIAGVFKLTNCALRQVSHIDLFGVKARGEIEEKFNFHNEKIKNFTNYIKKIISFLLW